MEKLTKEQLEALDQAARMFATDSNIVQIRAFLEEKGLETVFGVKFEAKPVITIGLEPPLPVYKKE